MAASNPYDDEVFDQPSAPTAVNPYEDLPVPSDTSAVTRAADSPYSAYNTVGRMASDALLGLPDTLNMAARGLNYGVDRGIQYLTGQTAPNNPPAIPYVAPIARKAVGVAELPEDAGLTRTLLEAGGSAAIGGVGSAATRGIVRGAAALPEIAASLNPWRPIKNVTEDALKSASGDWYKALDALDVRYNQQTPQHMADAIEIGGWKPRGINEVNAQQATNDVNQLRSIDPSANAPIGTVRDYVSPRDIEQVRQNLGTTRTAAPKLSGPREGEAANIAIKGIDNFFDNTPPSAIHPSNVNDPSLVGPVLGNARGNNAAANRLGYLTGSVEDIGTQFGAKPVASASNEVQALRDRAAKALIASNEGRGPLYGYNDYEKQLIEKISSGTGPIDRTLRGMGAKAPQSVQGILYQGVPASFALNQLGLSPQTSSMIASAGVGAQYVAKKLADWNTRRAFRTASEAIAARSPLAESMGIGAPQSARATAAPLVDRRDAIAALLAPSALRQPTYSPEQGN